MKMNYVDKVHKDENVLNNWQNKRLTLPGKITIIKMLAASQLIYMLPSLRTCFKWFAFQISLGWKKGQNQTV